MRRSQPPADAGADPAVRPVGSLTQRPLAARNPRIARLARLARQRSARASERAFVVEGPKLVGEALDAAWPLEAVFVETVGLARPAVAQVLGRCTEAGLPVWQVVAGALARAADTSTSQGIVAVAGWPGPLTDVGADDRADPEDDEPALVLLAHDINDPGNAGTLVRAADAAGATQVILTGRSVDPTNPKAVRAAAGALFHLPVHPAADLEAVLADLGARGVQRLATVVDGGVPYDEVDLTGPTALVLGSEAHGLPEWVSAAVDQPVTIPMRGRAESLNVAMAGAVVCFEAERQRRVRRAGATGPPGR